MCYTGWCIHEYAGDICRKPAGEPCPLEEVVDFCGERHRRGTATYEVLCRKRGPMRCPDVVGDDEGATYA